MGIFSLGNFIVVKMFLVAQKISGEKKNFVFRVWKYLTFIEDLITISFHFVGLVS